MSLTPFYVRCKRLAIRDCVDLNARVLVVKSSKTVVVNLFGVTRLGLGGPAWAG